jgi:hypothetical protein
LIAMLEQGLGLVYLSLIFLLALAVLDQDEGTPPVFVFAAKLLASLFAFTGMLVAFA